MKQYFFGFLIVLLASCAPSQPTISTPTATTVKTPTPSTTPSPTSSPTPVPTATLIFPLQTETPIPDSLKPINAENISQLTLLRVIPIGEYRPDKINVTANGRYAAIRVTLNMWPRNKFFICDILIGRCSFLDGFEATFSPNGEMVAVYDMHTHIIRISKFQNGEIKDEIKALESGFKVPMAFSPDGKMFGVNASTSWNTYRISDWALINEISTSRNPSIDFGRISLSPDWKTYQVKFSDGTTTIKQYSDNTILGRITGGEWSSDGQFFISGRWVLSRLFPLKELYKLHSACDDYWGGIFVLPQANILAVSDNFCSHGKTYTPFFESGGTIYSYNFTIVGESLLWFVNMSDMKLLHTIESNEYESFFDVSADGKLLITRSGYSADLDGKNQYELRIYGIP